MTCKHGFRDSAGRGIVPRVSTVRTTRIPAASALQYVLISCLRAWSIPSVCCGNIIMIYTGLQLSFCGTLDVQTEKLSHLQKKKKCRGKRGGMRGKPHPPNKTATKKPHQNTPNQKPPNNQTNQPTNLFGARTTSHGKTRRKSTVKCYMEWMFSVYEM